jgi:transcriptional regulator with XRE-family HTH domain
MHEDGQSMDRARAATLRGRRKRLGLTALQLADRAACPVEVVLRAEFGMAVPVDRGLRMRLAAAYGLEPMDYLRLALDAAERSVTRDAI